MKWNSSLYDNKHDFVAEYGKGLLEFIPHNTHQSILDIGCGTGVLTAQLCKFAERVVGIDSSEEMVERAKTQFPHIEFLVGDALALPYDQEWDIVFSNAVFHWIKDHDRLLKNISKALKPNGLLVCEFGATGNVQSIENAFAEALQEQGYSYKPKFLFESAENFKTLLENNGFIVEKIYDFDRPTVLKDGRNGLQNWIRQFYADELAGISETIRDFVIKGTEESVEASLWNGTEWIADYRRLRVIAKAGTGGINEDS